MFGKMLKLMRVVSNHLKRVLSLYGPSFATSCGMQSALEAVVRRPSIPGLSDMSDAL